jgi:hypothetical protein
MVRFDMRRAGTSDLTVRYRARSLGRAGSPCVVGMARLQAEFCKMFSFIMFQDGTFP